MRPARAKALIINAFALVGRFAIFNPYTQGAALGYVLFGLSARIYKTLNTTYSTIFAFKSKKIEFRFVNSKIICTFALAK